MKCMQHHKMPRPRRLLPGCRTLRVLFDDGVSLTFQPVFSPTDDAGRARVRAGITACTFDTLQWDDLFTVAGGCRSGVYARSHFSVHVSKLPTRPWLRKPDRCVSASLFGSGGSSAQLGNIQSIQ